MSERSPAVRRSQLSVERLLGPLITAQQQASGWRLVSWDTEQGISLVFARGGDAVLVELEASNLELDCYARTKRFNICARPQFSDSTDLGSGGRQLVDALVRYLQRREGLLQVSTDPTPQRAQVREVLADRILMPEGAGRYYVNPYAGCMIGCSFCYVADRADFSRRLEGVVAPRWGRWVDVKVNAVEILQREVRELAPGTVRLSPILTDPYQPIERRYRITRGCLAVLIEHGFSPVILTREARILDDLDILRSGTTAVGFSIPTDNDQLRRLFEPGADSVERRFRALEACANAGLTTCVVVQPTLPMDVQRFVERVAPFAKAARVDRLYFGETVQHVFDRLGIPEAGSTAYQEALVADLRQALSEAGLLVDDGDDLTGQLERLMSQKSSASGGGSIA